MPQFKTTSSIRDFQTFQTQVYGVPDDRFYSLSDLLVSQQKYTMRALKGIRKGDQEKLELNLCIALSWMMAVVNRLHINLEDAVWARFPERCSYCGKAPCVCKKIKQQERGVFSEPDQTKRPKTLTEFQGMFNRIYPATSRTLPDSGVHLAEEMGELAEAIHNFLGEHKDVQFEAVEHEASDYVSCMFGVANSAGINLSSALAELFENNCHVCHNAPCTCKFSFVATFES